MMTKVGSRENNSSINTDRDPDFSHGIQNKAVGFVIVFLATLLGCHLGIALFVQEFWTISPIWPAAGVSLAAFKYFGNRAWFPLMLGHCVLWYSLPLVAMPWLWFGPLLYPMAGWLTASLASWTRQRLTWRGSSEYRVFLADFVTPIVVLVPFSLLIAGLLTSNWSFGGVLPSAAREPESFRKIWVLVFIAHYLGMLTVTPLLSHCIQGREGKFVGVPNLAASLAVGLCVLGFGVMLSLFMGFDQSGFSSKAAVFLPLPFFVLAAVWLNRQQASLVVVLWCGLTFYLSGSQQGPFANQVGISQSHIELGFYNLLFVFMVTGVSNASSNHRNRIRQNALLLDFAEVIPWQWSREHGLEYEVGERCPFPEHWAFTIRKLACLREESSLLEIPSEWKRRLESQDLPKSDLNWETVGRIVSRNRRGEPESIVGLVRNVAVEEQARQALVKIEEQNEKLKVLAAQLNPHFLFNTLNMVRALIHSDAHKAEKAVLALSSLLRITLKNIQENEIPVASELKHVEALLEIAKMRFEERLEYEIVVEEVSPKFLVPSMLILNLVENAITHGISQLPNGGSLKVHLRPRSEGEGVEIMIRNSGHLASELSKGVGLDDAQQRLNLLYGSEADLKLSQFGENSVLCILTLPLNK